MYIIIYGREFWSHNILNNNVIDVKKSKAQYLKKVCLILNVDKKLVSK